MSMKKEVKEQWLEALRSDKYRQARNTLRSETGKAFCCLGVLNDLYMDDDFYWESTILKRKEDSDQDSSIEEEFVHPEIANKLGVNVSPKVFTDRDVEIKLNSTETLKVPAGTSLWELNDGREDFPKLSFKKIAEVIEKGIKTKEDDEYVN